MVAVSRHLHLYEDGVRISLSPSSVSRYSGDLVLHIVGSLDGGGAERWTRELVPRLRSRGMPSEIVTVYPPRLDGEALVELGVPVHTRPKRPGFDVAHFLWLVRLLRSRRPAIVHTHQWAGKYVGRLAALVSGVPFVVHTEHSPSALGRPERVLAELLWRRTDATITFTATNAEMIRSREPVKAFEIIRNGLPISPVPSSEMRRVARERIGLADDTIVFGVVASLQERKNPALALRAFAKLGSGGASNTRLDFFGDGPLREELVKLADGLGVSDRVRFHGFRPDVRDLLPGLDVFLTVAIAEIAPVSILEAMVACLPVIGTPHPGTLEMVENEVSGLIVDYDDDVLARAMSRARDDDAWRHTAGAAGRARVERDFDIEEVADQHVRFYRRLLNGRYEQAKMPRLDSASSR
jgi:glycosyltransferase involved in cell wall biosynthesis